MVDAVVSFTIEKLNDFVTKQVSIRTGVKAGIEWLKDELGYLLISVTAAEAHQDQDHIRLWTDSVRDVAIQADVILERFIAQQEEHAAAEQGGVLDRMRSFICICKKEANLFDMGKAIEALKEKIIGIKNRRDEYHINDIPYQSWELFCKRAKPTLNLEILGREMVGKCGGLPLAIVILSGLLLQMKTYTFWSDVKDHLWRKLKNKSLEIEELLNLCYDDLSFPMRKCFLYLARFPEDYSISVLELKLLWIAEEFISEVDEEGGVVMEDVAEDYVNELANRNMIQIQFLSPEGQVLDCRVHDLVRVLAIEKAREHKILGIFDSSKERANPPIRDLQGQARHAIYNGIGEYLKLLGPNYDVSMLRSLVITKNGNVRLQVEEVKLMCTKFKYLKVLDLRRVRSSGRIPEEIGDIILLKFLGLIDGGLVIPPSIGKLKKLQTLIGVGRYIFPKEMCELKEIRHLCFRHIKGKLNIGKDQTKLQSIHCISYTEWFQIDTIHWTNLRTLVIDGSEEEAGYNLESIANLTNLRTLCLNMRNYHFPLTIQPLSFCKNLKRVILMGKIKDPEELGLLPHSVTDLTLWYTNFRKDPMPTLGSLPNLTSLDFYGAYTGDGMVCSADAFPCLQFFRVGRLSKLRELQVDDGALPSLKAFLIESCPRIEMDRIPQRVMSLPPLPPFNPLSGY